MNHYHTHPFQQERRVRRQLQPLAFWRDWPLERQRWALYLLLVLTVLAATAIWFWLHAATLRAAEREEAVMERHQKVSELVAEIRALERGADAERANLPILIGARQISRDIGLEEKLVSVRPALQTTGRDGVQLYYERLTLPDLLALLEALNRESGLQSSTVTFNRRMDNPSLADLQMVLFR